MISKCQKNYLYIQVAPSTINIFWICLLEVPISNSSAKKLDMYNQGLLMKKTEANVKPLCTYLPGRAVTSPVIMTGWGRITSLLLRVVVLRLLLTSGNQMILTGNAVRTWTSSGSGRWLTSGSRCYHGGWGFSFLVSLLIVVLISVFTPIRRTIVIIWGIISSTSVSFGWRLISVVLSC